MIEQIHKDFVDYFLQTYSIQEAARKAGIPKDRALQAGIDMISNPEVQAYLQHRASEYDNAIKVYKLTKERLVGILFNQYEKANQKGDTRGAADILTKIAEAQGLDLKTVRVDPINLIINNLDENKI